MQSENGSFAQQWADLSEEVLSGMRDWRVQHPQATLQEIETELDCRLARVRARMLEHLAQQSQATTWSRAKQAAVEPAEGEPAEGGPAAGPRCPQCRTPLEPRGRKTRRLRTQGDQELLLQREYGVCPQCGQGLFPPR
jgi:hypothetical protein